MEPRDQCEHKGGCKRARLQEQESRRRVELHPERACNGNDLHDGIRFPPDAGPEVSKASRQMEKHGDDQDAEIPAEDQNSHAGAR